MKETVTPLKKNQDDTPNSNVGNETSIRLKNLQHRSLSQRAESYSGNLNLSDELSWEEMKGDEVW